MGGPLENSRHGNEVPGPGSYPIITTPDVHAATLKSRLPDLTTGKSVVPGPGAYNPPPLINANGKYISSNHINSKAGRFSIAKSLSSHNKRELSPGPGQCTFKRMQMELSRA